MQPVGLRFPGTRDTVTWTTDNLAWVMVRTLASPFTRAEAVFLPVKVPSPQARWDPTLYAEEVRQSMAQALGLQLYTGEVSVLDPQYRGEAREG